MSLCVTSIGPAGENWLDVAISSLQQRIQRYQMGEIRFNLIAICKDRIVAANEKIEELEAIKLSLGDNASQAEEVEAQLQDLKQQISDEEVKRKRWRVR